jgi:two-component system, sensor histidine kinase and response regulator
LRKAGKKKVFPKPAAIRPSGASRRTREVRRPMRILVAEDNPVNQQLVLQILGHRGHTILVAENGKQAVAAVERHAFDLVLMDVQMPEMGGIEATQRIREHEKSTGAHLPILAMTAHAMEGDRERCLAAGMDGYIAKPIEPKTFLDTVESATPPVAAVSGDGQGPEAEGAFDEGMLLGRFNGNRTLLRLLVKTFRDDCPKMMGRIRSALGARDTAALADAAHGLKGSVGNFGTSAAQRTARKMEMMGRRGTLDGAWETYAVLEDDIARLLPALHVIGDSKGRAGRHSRSHQTTRRKR